MDGERERGSSYGLEGGYPGAKSHSVLVAEAIDALEGRIAFWRRFAEYQ